MLLGAALLASGMLVSALADRIRGLRATREAAPARAAREKTSASTQAPRAIPVVESATLLPATPPKRSTRLEPKPCTNTGESDGEDVIAVLVQAGYKKPVATEAAWACTGAERATVETWTTAALRRCARGGMS